MVTELQWAAWSCTAIFFFSLQSGDIRPLAHWLESVKILPPGGFPANKPANYGDVTYGAVAKIEIEDAHRARAHCLAITDEFFDPSRPSSWSGAIDQACAGSLPGDDDDRSRRLFLIASGNTVDNGKIDQVLALRALEDPAQSWNAITIGGYTAKENIYPTGSELRPAVKANNRSPYGRGSVGFDRSLMPIKPEVVFEAGNMAVNASNDCISHELIVANFDRVISAHEATSSVLGNERRDGDGGKFPWPAHGCAARPLERDLSGPHGSFG